MSKEARIHDSYQLATLVHATEQEVLYSTRRAQKSFNKPHGFCIKKAASGFPEAAFRFS
jgi:hypothetical protein